MTEDTVVDIARGAIWIVVKTSAPLLLVSLIIGLIVSIFQTVTSIQEQTLTFVPKLLSIFIVIALCGGWIMNTISEYFISLMTNISQYIH